MTAHGVEPMRLTVGPLLYWWPREALMRFYADVALGAAHTVVLGEQVCSRRNEFKLADWMALGHELAQAGKRVVLATQALVMSEAELRSVRRVVEQDAFAIEAADASALRLLAQAHQAGRLTGRPFVLGPHINIYSRAALAEHAGFGAGTWVAPIELAIDAVACVNPPEQPVIGAHGPIRSEVFAFGRLPLAFSARCFTARHHRLNKDECGFRCRDDADGLALASGDGAPFLVLNGTQTQSAALHCLIDAVPVLRAAGVASLRLSPCSEGFAQVVDCFDAVCNRGLDAAEGRAQLSQLGLPGALVNGYAHHRPGMEALSA